MANEEYSTPPLIKKRLFEYAPDSEEKFELKNNETKNHVLVVVADADATLNTTYELETKQPTKTLTKKSKTNFNTINDDNNNNNNNNNNNKKKSPWSKKKTPKKEQERESERSHHLCSSLRTSLCTSGI